MRGQNGRPQILRTVWIEGDMISGLSDGDPIGTAPDGSGSGNDFAQSTEAAKPLFKESILNGHPVVRFDGTDDWLDGGDISAFDGQTYLAIYLVLAPKQLETWAAFFGKKGADLSHRTFMGMSGAGYGENDDIIAGVANGANTFGYSDSSVCVVDSFRIFSFIFDGAQTGNDRLKLYVNGTQKLVAYNGSLPSSTADTGDMHLGRDAPGGAFPHFDLALFLAYNSEESVSTATRQTIEDFYSSKYAISLD